jgi:formate dehydrogenase maturation protein FdhE
MHLDPHVAIAAVSTLGAAWLMVKAGLQKSALEHRRQRRVCPSCGRQIQARVCTSCAS